MAVSQALGGVVIDHVRVTATNHSFITNHDVSPTFRHGPDGVRWVMTGVEVNICFEKKCSGQITIYYGGTYNFF